MLIDGISILFKTAHNSKPKLDEVEGRIALMQYLSIPVEAYNQFVT